MRHPLSRRSPPAGVLVALAIPALSMHTANSRHGRPAAEPAGAAGLPRSSTTSFPGGASAAVVAIKADDGRRPRRPIAELKQQALASGEMQEPIHVERERGRHVSSVDIPLAGSGTDKVSTTPW